MEKDKANPLFTDIHFKPPFIRVVMQMRKWIFSSVRGLSRAIQTGGKKEPKMRQKDYENIQDQRSQMGGSRGQTVAILCGVPNGAGEDICCARIKSTASYVWSWWGGGSSFSPSIKL